MPIERLCYAKINLALAVGRPLPANHAHAGMHPICSWMTCVDLADRLLVERTQRLTRFERRGESAAPPDWPESRDLVVRAHALLERHAARPLPVFCQLTKRIPPGGGLGGGSSDAAAMLQALRDLFELAASDEELRTLSAELGSDVAFFLDGSTPCRPAIVSGLGDRIERLAPMDIPVTLILPPFGCATGEVYRTLDLAERVPGSEDAVERAARDSDTSDLFNDLFDAAVQVQPALADLRQRAEQASGTRVHLSGSGSTMFAIGVDPEQLAKALPTCRIISTRTR